MKRTLFLFICVLIGVFSSCTVSAYADAAWDGSVDTSWYDTKFEKFTLTSAAQLAGFAQLVNGGEGFEGKTVQLGCDIRLNSGDFSSYGAYNGDKTTVNYWTPIGRKRSYFSGVFDGMGHTISGMYISTAEGYCGLFGYSTGEIRNVSVVDGSVRGGDRSAAVCGFNRNGIIEGCYSDCYVYSPWWGGGICGVNSGSASILRCANNGMIKADINAGGICGMNQESYAVIENCFNSGSVQSYTVGSGGICGLNDCAKINNCINVGKVNGDEPYPISDKFTAFDGGGYTQINSSYYLSGQGFAENCGGIALTAEQMCDGAHFAEYFVGFDEEIWYVGTLAESVGGTSPSGSYIIMTYPKIKGVGEPVCILNEVNPDTGEPKTGASVVSVVLSAAFCAIYIKRKDH